MPSLRPILPTLATAIVLLCGHAGASVRVSLGVAPAESGRYVPGAVTTLVQAVLEEELSRAPRVDLVERSRLNDVLEELSFQQSGLTHRASATPIGKHSNAGNLVFVEVSKAGTRYDKTGYHLSVKVVDVTTNNVVWTAAEAVGKSDREVTKMTRRVARRLASVALSFSPVEMVFFPAGSFRMGSDDGRVEERPPHVVSVGAFYLDHTEVSTASYNAFLHTHGREMSTRTPSSDSPATPATMVNWHDAQAYCGSQDKRLPTEAEWEYAARGMSDATTYPWGESPPDHSLARYLGATAEPVEIDALSQGASPQGVLHLAGNVAEWVGDWWDPLYYASSPSDNPRGPSVGDYKVVRGGSWSQPAAEIRGAARSFHSPDRGAAYIGFRCARTFIKTK